jgi:2Fe-2S ferredoxin
LEKISDKSEMEEAMLSLSPDRKLNSRLACQIPITEELDGLEVSMPEFQF